MMMNFRGAVSSHYRHFLCKSANLQRRTYHIGVSSTDNESMVQNNIISRRLYRILLRSCKQGVDLSNKGNYIDNVAASNINCLLLQPPMDPRKYGFAKIAKARRNNDDVGMAMEVLRFVHLLLGGDADDDLNHYYLGISDDNNNVGSSSAGRHSEGHYTQFLDEDEERGEGSKDLSGTYGDSLDKDIDVDDDEEETADETEELEVDQSILVTSDDLINAVRIAFRAPLTSPTPSSGEETLSRQSIIQRRQRDAIDTAQILSAQLENWSDKSSVSVDLDHGVRVVATSSCLMTSSTVPPGQYTYKYAYRIRVENIVDLIDAKKEALGDEPSDSAVENRAVQLLGRTWRISEVRPKNANHVSTLQRLLEDGALTKEGGQHNDHEDEEETREVQVVNEPRTGAVGHLPVLGPGEVFEYMSGK